VPFCDTVMQDDVKARSQGNEAFQVYAIHERLRAADEEVANEPPDL